jgi:hypothetical protein
LGLKDPSNWSPGGAFLVHYLNPRLFL